MRDLSRLKDKQKATPPVTTGVFRATSPFEAECARLRDVLAERDERIAALQEELARAKSREEAVGQALLTAADKQEEMNATLIKRWNTECERIKQFQNKWHGFCTAELNTLSDTAQTTAKIEGFLTAALVEIKKTVSEIFGVRFDEEREDLNDLRRASAKEWFSVED